VSRDERLSLDDITEACSKIAEYIQGMDITSFRADRMRYDAVLHNLVVMGEAVKNLSENLRANHPEVNWRGIAGFRDIAVHEYFGVDDEILWDIVINEVPRVQQSVTGISFESAEAEE
jgi:uncharacterized protein with HEPN domain